MTTACPSCGLKRWDATDLTAGDNVCVCDADDWSDPLPDGTGLLAHDNSKEN